jgi:aspartyl-tRNA(Asn)/glutamyl-tRNA(Gln) amidotransferase subunit C
MDRRPDLDWSDMPLSEDQVRAIAADARIALSDAELEAMTADLNQILTRIQTINDLDLTGVEATFHPIGGLVNVLRDDEVRPSLPHDAAVANASALMDGQFKVPPILGDAGGDR